MLIILERRPRLLHMRASLERKCSQPRRHPLYLWTFFRFHTTWLRRDDLMATGMGKLHNWRNIIKPMIWKRDASRSISKGSTIASWKILDFVHPARTFRDEEVCIKMDDLADKDFCHYMTESEYFRYKQNWWMSLSKSGNTGQLRNRSDFNEALSTLNRQHQESGERQLRPMLFWKDQQRHQSSSSSSSWWQWSGSWWRS